MALYNVGSHCAIRSEKYHRLYHHKKWIFDALVSEIVDFELSRNSKKPLEGICREGLVLKRLLDRGVVDDWFKDLKDLLQESEDVSMYKFRDLQY